MGGIPGLVGLGGGAAGTSFAGPVSAGITDPTSPDQLNTAYNGTQSALNQQTNLLQALQAQNGLGNQNQVYGQLQGIANGTGPNPAQAMLNQATGQNVSNQAALMAGQRGAAGNVGLMARQAAQQGANAQQQAVGQGATMQANQSLNALGAAGNMANTQAANQIGQTNTNFASQQAEQQALLNSTAQYNAANVGMQSNVNNVNGQLANTQMQGQQAMIGGAMSGLSGLMGGMAGGAKGGMITKVRGFDDGGDVGGGDVGSYNTSTPTFGSDSGAAALAKGMGGGGGGSGGGGGIMSMLPMLAMAAAEGGEASPAMQAPPQQQNMGVQGPQSSFGQFITGLSNNSAQIGSFNDSTPSFGDSGAGAAALTAGSKAVAQKATTKAPGPNQQDINQNAKDAKVSDPNPQPGQTPPPTATGTSGSFEQPGAPAYSQAQWNSMPSDGGSGGDSSTPTPQAKGGMIHDFSPGGKVRAVDKKQKAVAKGNSYSNDKIPAILSEKEIVLPRSVTLSSDPVGNAAKFVAQIIAKRKKK